jgi:hypothetical protein
LLKVVADAHKMTGKYDCKSCITFIEARTPITPTTSRATQLLRLLHSAICGLLETALGGSRYMLLFIDDSTRHPDKYILKNKSKALQKFKERKALRKKESGKEVKPFRRDGGSEYTSKMVAEYLTSEGIISETTMLCSP